MKKNRREEGQTPEASEGARRATGEASGVAPDGRGRFSAPRKWEAVERLLRGESEDEVSRALGVTASTVATWRDIALQNAISSLKMREPDAKDEESQRLKAKIGELSMEVELLYEKVHKMEAKHPLLMRRLRP
jgi:hypothetical protein